MADIRVERKEGTNWLWWVLGLIVLALVIWAIVAAFDTDAEVAEAPGIVAPAMPEPVAAAPGVALNEVLGSPATWVGREWAGEVQVTEVPTDRGFWITDQGARLFAVVVDQPQEQPVDINPGQMLRIEEGMLHDAAFLTNLPGAPLDADTRRIAEAQSIFLVVDEEDINILSGTAATP